MYRSPDKSISGYLFDDRLADICSTRYHWILFLHQFKVRLHVITYSSWPLLQARCWVIHLAYGESKNVFPRRNRTQVRHLYPETLSLRNPQTRRQYYKKTQNYKTVLWPYCSVINSSKILKQPISQFSHIFINPGQRRVPQLVYDKARSHIWFLNNWCINLGVNIADCL